jgi:hypothetical protein
MSAWGALYRFCRSLQANQITAQQDAKPVRQHMKTVVWFVLFVWFFG